MRADATITMSVQMTFAMPMEHAVIQIKLTVRPAPAEPARTEHAVPALLVSAATVATTSQAVPSPPAIRTIPTDFARARKARPLPAMFIPEIIIATARMPMCILQTLLETPAAAANIASTIL